MSLETHWHKRVPADMAGEYIERGWVILAREGATVVLVWPGDEVPR